LVHDCIINEAPNNRFHIEQLIDIISDTMMQTPKDWLNPEIEFPVEIKIGKTWGDMKEIDVETKELIK
jgi:DNA polymerase I-like protein with 3'-5' exonuclease and polymerase domains